MVTFSDFEMGKRYGTISPMILFHIAKFHHRCVQEYVASEVLGACLLQGDGIASYLEIAHG